MKKILAIIHDVYAQITDDIIHKTLTEHYGECHFTAIRFDKIHIEHGDQNVLDWSTWKEEQGAYYKEVIQPQIEENPNRQIVYFGRAPIPLCMHLGYLIGELQTVDVFQRLHDESNNWTWGNEKNDKLIINNLPKKVSKSTGSTVIRFGVYSPIDSGSTDKMISNPSHETDVYVKNFDADYFKNMEELKMAAEDFFKVIKSTSEMHPNTDGIHLFASVSCGLAFLMGKKIQRNVHRNISIYQYHGRHEPKYTHAFIIQEQTEQQLVISKKQLIQIEKIRKELEVHYRESIEWFISENAESDHTNWFLSILPKNKSSSFTQSPWDKLSKIGSTILAGAQFSDVPFDKLETKFFVDGAWYFPNWLIFRLNEKFKNDDLNTAMRLFWFHEGIHYTDHGVNSDNSEGLGRYGRVLEEADYQSDVYALFCEYGLMKQEAFKTEVEFFAKRIEIIIKTLQAFDGEGTIARMQTRRVNRYLIWYFQLARIRHAKCTSLEDVIVILSNKPHIDLKLPITLYQNKISYQLSGFQFDQAGIAFFYNNKVRSFGPNGNQLNLKNLIDGLRTKNSDAMMEVMRQALPAII